MSSNEKNPVVTQPSGVLKKFELHLHFVNRNSAVSLDEFYIAINE